LRRIYYIRKKVFKMTDIHSLSSELDERLSSIFGEDVSEKEGLETTGGSPLAELQVLMLTIDWEISDDTLNAFNKELESLKRLLTGAPYVPPLLKMLSSIIGYLKNKKSRAHPNTLNILRSVFACLERVVESADLSFQEKKALLDSEIEGFKKLKSDITGTPATLTAHVPSDRLPVSPDRKPKSEHGEAAVITTEGESGAAVQPETPSKEMPYPDYVAEQVKVLNAYIHDEMAALKGELRSFSRELDEIQGALSQTRDLVEDIRGKLQEIPAVASILSEIQSRIATLSIGKTSLDTDRQNPPDPDDFWNDPDTIKSVPLNLEVANQVSAMGNSSEKVGETKSSFEPDAADHPQIEEQRHAFFFFELGGNKYAVNENHVMKPCKIGARAVRKARAKGEISLDDCKTPFRSIKRGIEAAWKNVSARDLKKQKFTLIHGPKLEGLLDTNGGGILFLASGDKRMALLTDNLPQKEHIWEHLVTMADSGRTAISGKISKDGDVREVRLIIDADTLL
jgi:hypothetical protein